MYLCTPIASLFTTKWSSDQHLTLFGKLLNIYNETVDLKIMEVVCHYDEQQTKFKVQIFQLQTINESTLCLYNSDQLVRIEQY